MGKERVLMEAVKNVQDFILAICRGKISLVFRSFQGHVFNEMGQIFFSRVVKRRFLLPERPLGYLSHRTYCRPG